MKVILTLLMLVSAICVSAQREHISSEGITFAISDTKQSDANDGAIVPDITTGFRPFSYIWTGPDNFISTDSVLRNVKPGIYHLKIEDALCGKFSDTLEVKSMEEERPYEFLINNLGPNPFEEEITIDIKTDLKQVIDVKLFHTSGNLVLQKRFELSEGDQRIELNNLFATPGIYILQICNENNCRTTKRLIKVN